MRIEISYECYRWHWTDSVFFRTLSCLEKGEWGPGPGDHRNIFRSNKNALNYYSVKSKKHFVEICILLRTLFKYIIERNISLRPDCLKGHWRLFVLVSSFYIFSGYVC